MYDCYFLVILRMLILNGSCLDKEIVSVEKVISLQRRILSL